jgi:hypothetical protein
MVLPPFRPPTYDELRTWWRLHQADDVRRLILEVQSQRYFLAELRGVAEACRNATMNDQPLEARTKQLNWLLRQIDTEIGRINQIYRTPPTSHPNAPNFRNNRK